MLGARRRGDKAYEETVKYVSIYGYLHGGLFSSGPEPSQGDVRPSKDKNPARHVEG